jgi:hypothetical protein
LPVSAWNVLGVPGVSRTTNALERLHRYYKAVLKENSSLYEFLVRLRRMQSSLHITEAKHRATGSGPHIRAKATRLKAARMQEEYERWQAQPAPENTQTLMCYLLKIGHLMMH